MTACLLKVRRVLFFSFLFSLLKGRVSPYSPGCPGIQFYIKVRSACLCLCPSVLSAGTKGVTTTPSFQLSAFWFFPSWPSSLAPSSRWASDMTFLCHLLMPLLAPHLRQTCASPTYFFLQASFTSQCCHPQNPDRGDMAQPWSFFVLRISQNSVQLVSMFLLLPPASASIPWLLLSENVWQSPPLNMAVEPHIVLYHLLASTLQWLL